jgi:hypothetical protein
MCRVKGGEGRGGVVVVELEVYPLKHETRLDNIYTFSPYREENTTLHRYKDRLFKEIIAVYLKNCAKPINKK